MQQKMIATGGYFSWKVPDALSLNEYVQDWDAGYADLLKNGK